MIAVEGLDDFVRLHGYPSADKILNRLASRLTDALRAGDLLVRADRDCFAVVLTALSRPDVETVLQIAGRLQQGLNAPVDLGSVSLNIDTSVGIFLQGRAAPHKTGEEMLQSAEMALLAAREAGPGATRVFSEDMKAAAIRRSETGEELSLAFEAGQIRAWFQPQVSTDTGEVLGFEALARWHHPERGVLAPGAFLDAAAYAGLSARLSEEMLFQTLSALRSWDSAGLDVPLAGVNLSASELRMPRLADRIAWELDRFGLQPQRLAIEILETVASESAEATVLRNIEALANLGCHIDLDDFGTGNASIASIRRFSVSRLKIDRSFVSGMDQDRSQQDVITAILSMAEKLNLRTVAEGVETIGEHAMLAQLGCTAVQGFGIARPMPLEDTFAWYERHQAKLPDLRGIRYQTR